MGNPCSFLLLNGMMRNANKLSCLRESGNISCLTIAKFRIPKYYLIMIYRLMDIENGVRLCSLVGGEATAYVAGLPNCTGRFSRYTFLDSIKLVMN